MSEYITAKEARQIVRSYDGKLDDINLAIQTAAKAGEVGVWIKGELSWPVNNYLEKKLGYETTVDSANNRVWVWWGN